MTKLPQSSDHPIIQSSLNGWITLDKPSGITSAQAVARVKSSLRGAQRRGNPDWIASPSARNDIKIGHAGTLDPLASGILPLALGEATKTIPYMMDAYKAYEFTVTWGQERDTDDCEGKIIRTSDNRPTQQEIEAILPQFTGTIRQTPPAYSAIKVGGKRAYDLSRAGEAVELKAREVRIFSLSLRERVVAQPPGEGGATRICPHRNPLPQAGEGITEFRCHCSKGTYIRSLARDMGRAIGCFGTVSRLRRVGVGRFGEADAISLETLEKEVYKGGLGFLLATESALDDIPAVTVDEIQAAQLKRGQNVVLPLNADSSTVIARCNGKLVAICEWKDGRLKPVRVFNL